MESAKHVHVYILSVTSAKLKYKIRSILFRNERSALSISSYIQIWYLVVGLPHTNTYTYCL